MLSIGKVKSAAGAAKYFAADDYYTQDNKEGCSEWFGKGSKLLGLSGEVESKQFEEILSGKLPNGKQLGVKRGDKIHHRPGYDLTFSAPKSVSLLIEATQDQRLIDAHRQAVKDVLAYIEQEFAAARYTSNGVTGMVKTDNLTIALFHHDISRDVQPQTHTHAVSCNVTHIGDEQYRALASQRQKEVLADGAQGFMERVFASKKFWGFLYRMYLAHYLIKLGYKLYFFDHNFYFEVKGVPRDLIDRFSSRRAEIEREMKRQGVSGGKAAAKVALQTRANKHKNSADHREDFLKVCGKDIEALYETRDKAQANRMKYKPPNKEEELQRAELAIKYSISSLAEGEAVFNKFDILQKAMAFMAGSHPDVVKNTLEKFTSSKELINVTPGKFAIECYTTPLAIAREHELIKLMQTGKKSKPALVKKAAVQELLKQHKHLTSCQAKALECILSSEDNMVGIQGYAGTGKTTLLKSLKEIADKHNIVIKGMAPSAVAAREMQNSLQIECVTLAKFLTITKPVDNPATKSKSPAKITTKAPPADVTTSATKTAIKATVAEAKTLDSKNPAKPQEAKNETTATKVLPTKTKASTDKTTARAKSSAETIWLLDEASMVSTQQFLELAKLAKSHKVRLIALGDKDQLGAIDAGKPFADLQRRGMLTATLKTLVRQKKGSKLWKIITELVGGNVAESLKLMQPHIEEIPPLGEKVRKAVSDYFSLAKEQRQNTIVMTATNNEREKVNEAIRSELRQRRELGLKSIDTRVLASRNLTNTEQSWAGSYKEGDVVFFNSQAKQMLAKLAQEKGLPATDKTVLQPEQYYTVDEIYQDRNKLFLCSTSGIYIAWSLELRHSNENKKSMIEVYEHRKRSLAVGELISWRRNNRDKIRINAERAKITDIDYDDRAMLVEVKGGKSLRLNLDNLAHQHFDYAYAGTVFSAQGKTSEYAIKSCETTNSKLVTRQAFYVGITRARKFAKVYTDELKRYVDLVTYNLGEKSSALESLDNYEKALAKEQLLAKQQEKQQVKRYDVAEVKRALQQQLPSILSNLLGEPNSKLSSSKSKRYGKKGSLVVNQDGSWKDFETGEGGDIIKLIANKTDMQFKQALEYAAQLTNIKATVKLEKPNKPKYFDLSPPTPDKDDLKSIAYANKLWQRGKPIAGTLAERYLKQRAIKFSKWSTSLRFLPKHYHSPSKRSYPVLLVAAHSRCGKIEAVQRIYLDAKTGLKAKVMPSKMTVGKLKFGARVNIQVGDSNTLYIAEGPETALSIAQAKPEATVIATLSVGNIKNANLPAAKTIILCADNDKGMSHAEQLLKPAIKALQRENRNLKIAIPDKLKTDFNDVHQQSGITKVTELLEQATSVQFNATTKGNNKLPPDVTIQPPVAKADLTTTKTTASIADLLAPPEQGSNPDSIKPPTQESTASTSAEHPSKSSSSVAILIDGMKHTMHPPDHDL